MELAGASLREVLHDEIFNNSIYEDMSDERRKTRLLSIILDFRDEAKARLEEEFASTLGADLERAREDKEIRRFTPGPAPRTLGVGQ